VDQNIGFVGLGSMGLPIARNLTRAGYRLRVYNRTPSRAEPLLELDSVDLVRSPSEAAEPGGIVFTMLIDDDAVEHLTVGEDGLAARLGPEGLHISMSTIAPATCTRLAQLGSGYLAAPVFGRPDNAASAELIVLSAGMPRARERARPLLEVIGSALYELGDDPATANAVKLVGNFLLMSAMEAISEAFAFAEKNHVPRKLAAEVLTGTPLMANAYKIYGAAIADGKFTLPGATIKETVELLGGRVTGSPRDRTN
jgi:3-hydroxyisobutyrate dehydrogenase-like beta-hydroxyacid dehydrogenase